MTTRYRYYYDTSSSVSFVCTCHEFSTRILR